MSNLTLLNVAGESVKIPDEVAKRLFYKCIAVDSFVLAMQSPSAGSYSNSSRDGEDERTEDEPLHVEQLNVSKGTLEAVAYYAMLPDDQRTANIPKPMTRRFAECVKPHEVEMLKKAEEYNYLIELFNIALTLRFELLFEICGAYMSDRVREISERGPDIMTASEYIRKFMHIENSWTPEEMEHLSREMALAKKLDPHAY